MERHKSALKRVRQNKKRREKNRYFAKTTRNAVTDVRLSDDKEKAKKELSQVVSMIDKLVKRGQIHKNKAANLKSGLAKKVNALK